MTEKMTDLSEYIVMHRLLRKKLNKMLQISHL